MKHQIASLSLWYTNPSTRGHSRLGPSTMAILLGVILLTAWCSDKHDRNWTRYLRQGEVLNISIKNLMAFTLKYQNIRQNLPKIIVVFWWEFFQYSSKPLQFVIYFFFS